MGSAQTQQFRRRTRSRIPRRRPRSNFCAAHVTQENPEATGGRVKATCGGSLARHAPNMAHRSAFSMMQSAPSADSDSAAGPALPRRFGRYQLFDRIGRGGMADIFLARAATELGAERLVVVKQIH